MFPITVFSHGTTTASFATHNLNVNTSFYAAFSPLGCGTVDTLHLQMTRTGNPLDKPFSVTVYAMTNSDMVQEPSTDTIVATGTVYPTSVPAGTSVDSFYYQQVALTPPFFIDDTMPELSSSPFSSDILSRRYARGMAIQFARTAANSDGDLSNTAGVVFTELSRAGEFGNPLIIGARDRNSTSASTGAFLMFGLFGANSAQVNSSFNDRLLDDQSDKIALNLNVLLQNLVVTAGGLEERGMNFSAKGNQLTRAATFIHADGTSGVRGLRMLVYPNTLNGTVNEIGGAAIGSSELIYYNTSSGISNGVDWDDRGFMAIFVFSPALSLTSGQIYWMTISANSHSGFAGGTQATAVNVFTSINSTWRSVSATSGTPTYNDQTTRRFYQWFVDTPGAVVTAVDPWNFIGLYGGVNVQGFSRLIPRESLITIPGYRLT